MISSSFLEKLADLCATKQLVLFDISIKNVHTVTATGELITRLNHTNGIIIKPMEATVERFEPNGGGAFDAVSVDVDEWFIEHDGTSENALSPEDRMTLFNIQNEITDLCFVDLLLEEFEKHLYKVPIEKIEQGKPSTPPSLVYKSPFDVCPYFAVQSVQFPGDAGEGYCVAWSTYIMHLQLLNPAFTTAQLSDYLLVHQSSEQLLEFIKRYITFMDLVIAQQNSEVYNTHRKYKDTKEPSVQKKPYKVEYSIVPGTL